MTNNYHDESLHHPVFDILCSQSCAFAADDGPQSQMLLQQTLELCYNTQLTPFLLTYLIILFDKSGPFTPAMGIFKSQV